MSVKIKEAATFALSAVLMVILLGSALGSPTLSAYAVTTIHQKSLKDPDNDQDNDINKCKQDPDIGQDQKHIADIQAEILLDQGRIANFNDKINKLQADLALDMTNPIKHKNDIKVDTKELKHLQDDLAKELKDIAGDQANLAKEITDLIKTSASKSTSTIAILTKTFNNSKIEPLT